MRLKKLVNNLNKTYLLSEKQKKQNLHIFKANI